MSTEHTKEVASFEQTIKTLSVASDMFLVGKELAVQSLHTPPFAPSPEVLAGHVTNAVPDFRSLTEWERSFLLVNGLMTTYSLLERRAFYQRKFMLAPETITRQLLGIIESVSDHELQFDPNRVGFKWSLFSVSLVLPQEEFDEAVFHHFGKNQTLFGFVSRFATELGRIPFVLQGKQHKSTIWHEDIHVFRNEMGLSREKQTNMAWVVERPSIKRAVDNKNITHQDLEENEEILNKILEDVYFTIREEFAASLWSNEMPLVGVLDKPDEDQNLGFIYITLLNCIYAQSRQLGEAEQIARHYEALRKMAEVNLERQRLVAIARQAMDQYHGPKNKWGWVAARATITPPTFSTRLFQAIALGRSRTLREDPKIGYGHLLGIILVTHARRNVLTDPYGQGGPIPTELVQKFWEEAARIVNSPSLYSSILEKYKLSERDILDAKKTLIKYAEKSVPPGLRNKTRQVLEEKLI